MPINFAESSIPRYGWSKPTIVHIPTSYQQDVARAHSSDDPFAASDMHDIPLHEDSPYDDFLKQDGNQAPISEQTPSQPSPSPWGMGRSLTKSKPSSQVDRDEARSEWETVAGDDERHYQVTGPPKAKVTLKSLGLVPDTDDEDGGDDVKGKGIKPPFKRPGTPFDAFGFSNRSGEHEANPIRVDQDANYGSAFVHHGHTEFIRQPVYGVGVHETGPSRPTGRRGFPVNSKTSSSESTDHFKYDGEAYSTFLHPSSTRETKDSTSRPTTTNKERGLSMRAKFESKESTMPSKTAFYNPTALGSERSPETTKAENGECRPRAHTDEGTDADWQTVTTGPVGGAADQSELNLIKGTGSSLADVSDFIEEHPYPAKSYNAVGKISHRRNRSIHHLKGYYAETFAQAKPRVGNQYGAPAVYQRQQRTVREAFQPATRAAAPFRRPSNPFLTPPNWKTSGRITELEDGPDDYQPASSSKNVQAQADTTLALTRTDSAETVWPQVIRHNETVNEFDQAFCETRIKDTTLPSDDSTNAFSRLPFELIDLKEAAKTYGSQRYRNADEADSFAQRARLGPLWSGYSNEAGPSSSGGYRFGGSNNPPVTRPSTAVFRDQITNTRPTVEFDFVDNTPSPSSAILGSLRSKLSLRPKSQKPQPARFGHFKAAAALGAKCLRIKAPPSKSQNSNQIWALSRNETGGVLTPSEAELIESARGEIMDRRRSPEEMEHKRKVLFIVIVLSSIVFPLIGFLALLGKFDSTVCWYALGEMKGFTKEQRGMLMQQLLVETFIYTVLIIFLSLHFSGHL
ncbi:hypothetical protein M441DRAFT_68978 [Trichoderma asperellum CBS 433.97]|uniref:Uncharacterized protein n=1 Tax=Trichoderma asperellum (strain ATCC 204424 / CBS 433.97 / NBRC 101777) TaxID=1042311 RepID=A0A2T3Z6T3_TRIA4|nr:hypothetical protein M441DRAFT_68978 [Trichoderma asperellum CBS 433.97]PTB40524.1 hypothetical protein M441DRAFT_68978 [Trichoderma asperellum CBS 433.97]